MSEGEGLRSLRSLLQEAYEIGVEVGKLDAEKERLAALERGAEARLGKVKAAAGDLLQRVTA